MTLRPHPVTGEAFASPVAPGAGWPEDPASPDTPVARTPGGVRRLAARADLGELSARVTVCRACDRLVAWREQHAREPKREFAGEPYWGRPVPGLGAVDPTLLIVGLAPAAHGANRTGRTFTGDRSGDTLFAALHAVGLAERSTSRHAGDGQRLHGTRIVATVRCAPPGNRPTPGERAACAPWLERELALVRPGLRAIVCLGALGWGATWDLLTPEGLTPSPRPRFGHGAEVRVGEGEQALTVLGCFHPSPLNTQTGRLTPAMLESLLARAAEVAGLS